MSCDACLCIIGRYWPISWSQSNMVNNPFAQNTRQHAHQVPVSGGRKEAAARRSPRQGHRMGRYSAALVSPSGLQWLTMLRTMYVPSYVGATPLRGPLYHGVMTRRRFTIQFVWLYFQLTQASLSINVVILQTNSTSFFFSLWIATDRYYKMSLLQYPKRM